MNKNDFRAKLSAIWKKIKKFCRWILDQLKDVHNLIIFIIVVFIMSSEIWLCYILGMIFNSAVLVTFASACWLFWAGPMTPFFPLCVVITLAIRKVIDRLSGKKASENAEKHFEASDSGKAEKESKEKGRNNSSGK